MDPSPEAYLSVTDAISRREWPRAVRLEEARRDALADVLAAPGHKVRIDDYSFRCVTLWQGPRWARLWG
jgi:hypothetical protein